MQNDCFPLRQTHILPNSDDQRLQDLSDKNFNVAPERVTWAHVGDLAHYADLLPKDITEQTFRDGEYTE